LWDLTAEELLGRAASGDPTPGGGAIAAVTAAFGLSLLQMAIEITIAVPESVTEHLSRLEMAQGKAQSLQRRMTKAVDRDVVEFEALMAGYRMPGDTGEEVASRERAIAAAAVSATRGPLSLAEACVSAIALGDELEPLVKSNIVSDVQAGRDLLRGAALAALRTADRVIVKCCG
jgi:formiminotetrahydrofolate cyclodeaminase